MSGEVQSVGRAKMLEQRMDACLEDDQGI